MFALDRLRLILFAMDAQGRAALDYAGAAMAGGDHRRQRHCAYKQLSQDALDRLADRACRLPRQD